MKLIKEMRRSTMARYTFEMRELVSTFGRDEIKNWFMDYELSDYLTTEEIQVIEDKGTWSKEQLADRIIDHYFLREVGTDSVGAFKLMAKDLMQEIMETYAPLIYSASIKFDPLVNVDYTETFDRKTDNTSKSTSTTESSGTGLGINSDTPQGNINKEAILRGDYATSTNANETETKGTDASEAEGAGNEHYERRMRGNSGVSATAQRMVQQYRDLVRALNTEIVYELSPLFIGLY